MTERHSSGPVDPGDLGRVRVHDVCAVCRRTRDHAVLPSGSRICLSCAGIDVPPQRPRPRWRLRYLSWPRPRLVVRDTPSPHCPSCHGRGGWTEDYPDATGDYGGTRDIPCGCVDDDLIRTVLPLFRLARWLPRWWLHRRGYSDQPPF